jgi:hypothetical protein
MNIMVVQLNINATTTDMDNNVLSGRIGKYMETKHTNPEIIVTKILYRQSKNTLIDGKLANVLRWGLPTTVPAVHSYNTQLLLLPLTVYVSNHKFS